MKSKLQLNISSLFKLACLLIILCGTAKTVDTEPDFDEILNRTPYASLLKEIICLTDTIGLLRHYVAEDERRFIEDSILGKIVRAQRLMNKIDFVRILPEDIDYLYYWLKVATAEKLPALLTQQIGELKQALNFYVQKSLQ